MNIQAYIIPFHFVYIRLTKQDIMFCCRKP